MPTGQAIKAAPGGALEKHQSAARDGLAILGGLPPSKATQDLAGILANMGMLGFQIAEDAREEERARAREIERASETIIEAVAAQGEKTRAEVRGQGEETRRAVAEAGRKGKDYAARVAAFREFDKRLQDEGGTQAEIAKGLLDELRLVGAGGKRWGVGAFLNEWRRWGDWGRPDAKAYGARLSACRRGHKGA